MKKGTFLTGLCLQESFSKEVALAQVAQRGDGCPIPGDTQGQVGWSSEHLMEL